MDLQKFANHKAWLKTIPRETEQPNGLLYHYTTTKGLLGILDSGCMWATHIRYLNDWSEHKKAYSRKYTDNLADAFMNVAGDEFKKSFNELLKKEIEYDIYVVAFSDDFSIKAPEGIKCDGNRLSLWRSYSDETGGYSLGFDFSALSKMFFLPSVDKLKHAIWVSRCIYSDIDTDKLAVRVGTNVRHALDEVITDMRIDESYNELISRMDDTSEIVSLVMSRLATPYCIEAAHIKDEGFFEESEWRLIIIINRDYQIQHDSINSDNKIVHYRTGPFGITPYIKMPINLNTHDTTLKRIVVGPSPHPDEAYVALKRILETRKITNIEVDRSKIPFRYF